MRSVELHVDLSALQHNFAQVRRSAPNCKIFAVLKANGYGHNATRIAKSLLDADGFAVVVPGEAIELREAGIDKPILIIQGVQTIQDLHRASHHNLTVGVHCNSQLELITKIVDQLQKPIKVWIKLDTGMGRLGFKAEQLHAISAKLSALPNIDLEGCLTHFSCADELANSFTLQQLKRFRAATSEFTGQRSLANSAAVMAWPESHIDWVRPGIMLYGVNPLWPDQKVRLEPVMTVKAPIIAIRRVARGETIGYGNTYCCEVDMHVGVVAVGYGDGYPRHVSSDAYVMLNGKKCKILGRVSMDSIVIDLAKVPETKISDRATLWGKTLPVEIVAEFANTLSYELLCQIRGIYNFHK